MPALQEIVSYLDDLLRISEIPDYPKALNGLQLQNRSGEVTKVVAAVDANPTVIEKAIAKKADLLIVHHGLFWNEPRRIVGRSFEKLGSAIESNLAVYSAHIPLDIHPELGNNALLAKAIGLEGKGAPFMPWKGIHIGLQFETTLPLESLVLKVQQATGEKAHAAPGGPSLVHNVGLVTGGAGAEIESAAAQGVDTFITGEGQHWTFTLAEELGVNLVYGGHYGTEIFGVKALSAHLAEKFGVSREFVDHPTGL